MRFRSWRGPTPLPPSPRRSFPWARLLLLIGALAIVAYILIPRYFFLSADALVKGNLVPVTPLYRVRIDALLAHCSDRVVAGQKLAIVSNFMVQADYQRQYLQAASQLELSRVSMDEEAAVANQTVAAAHERYLADQLNAERLGENFRSYDEAYKSGAVGRADWTAKRSEWQSALHVAQSEAATWRRAQGEVDRIVADHNSKIASDQQLSDEAQRLAQRVGSEALLAPVSGFTVECTDRPQNVVEPGTPIFTIFEPERAYVLAYFDPGSAAKLHLDQPAEVSIAGLPHAVSGRVGAIYPDLTKLPDQLTRFFWQHVQWSEYRPVKIVFERISRDDRRKLYYGAQARVRVRLRDNWNPVTSLQSVKSP